VIRSTRTVLVTGATGNVGRHLVAGLLERGLDVRALVRRPSSAALPADAGVVEGDLQRPESVAAAADGADAAFLLWPGFSAEGADGVVAALAGRVEHVVYLSAARLQGDEEGAKAGVWADVERLVEASGVGWTFLRAGGFAANTLGWADQIRAGEEVRIPYPAAGRSLIHERDIADVAAEVLMDGAPPRQAFSLTGPEILTQAEQVRTIGEVIGRPLRVAELPPEAARREYPESALAYWATLVDAPERVTGDVARVTGRSARRFAEWAHDHAGDFAAS
jgi:uncharacterized protein YbjT (DUF2867 family)